MSENPNANKVTLPREVAEAIESIRAQGFENRNTLRAVHVENIVGRYDSDIVAIKENARTYEKALREIAEETGTPYAKIALEALGEGEGE